MKKEKKTSFQPLSKKSRYSSTDTGSCNTAARRSFPTGHGSGHGRLVTTCHHAMLRTERERVDQRYVARSHLHQPKNM